MMLRKKDRRQRRAQGWAFFKGDARRARPFQAQVYDPARRASRHVGHAATREGARALARAYLFVREAVPAASEKAALASAHRCCEDLSSGQAQLPLGDGLAAIMASDAPA